MRTPLQILTSISTATAAFGLPLVLATIAPSAPSDPAIEPMVEELELMVQLEQDEDEDPARPEAASKQAEAETKSSSKARSPREALEDAAKHAEEASAVVARQAHRGTVHARVATDWHVRPDRTLASTARPAPRKGKRRRACLEPVSGISETGPYRYDVERELLDHYTGNLREAEKLAATSWHKQDGEIDGFRVKKVRCGSPLHQLGFRNGDVIHSVNGKPVTTTTQALLAFRKVRKHDRLVFQVTGWKGDRKTLRFRMI